MEARKLVLLNSNQQVVRTLPVTASAFHMIQRKNSGRVEFVEDTSYLVLKKIKFRDLGVVRTEEAAVGCTDGVDGYLTAPNPNLFYVKDQELSQESDRVWYRVLFSLLGAAILILISLRWVPTQNSALENELRQQVVKIVRPKVSQNNEVMNVSNAKPTVRNKAQSLKRIGALAVLGSLRTGQQKGGVNLSQMKVTAGPGLGGEAGSGGVQTSIYAKGMIAAPLGPGSNLQGAGGYGTKGKGGGQAGYGTLSLVGHTGSDPIPLTNEATAESGLDKDLIASVINKNIGQIRFCYEQGLQGNPALSGRVAVDFTVGGDGLVKLAKVANTSLNSTLVEDCIVLRLKSWKFPLPRGGVDVKVSYPFVLRRAGNG